MAAQAMPPPLVGVAPPVGGSAGAGGPPASQWAALKAVLKKNWILTLRNKRDAFREYGTPLIMLLVLVMLNRTNVVSQNDAVLHNPTQPIGALKYVAAGRELWFAPCTLPSGGDFASSVASSIASTGGNVTCFPCETAAQCGSGSLMTAYAQRGGSLLAAVVFDETAPNPAAVPPVPVRYRIRMDGTQFVTGAGFYNVSNGYAGDGSPLPPDSAAGSYAPWFLPVQWALDTAIRSVLAPDATAAQPAQAGLYVRQFPSPGYSMNFLASSISIITPIYMTLIFTMTVRVLLTRILEEKEKKIKVTLKMMGLADTTFWCAWTITALLKALFLVTAVVGIACAAGVFKYSSFGLLWVFYMLFGLTCISFSFAVTSLFSKSRTGGAVGMLVYLALAAPAYALTGPSVPIQLKGFLSLLAPCAFNLGNTIVTNLEQARVGATAANFGDANATAAGVSLGFLSGMLALDFVLYTLLAIYLDKVVPTEFGSTQHPLFCLGFRRSAVTATGGGRRSCFGRGGGSSSVSSSGRKGASPLLALDGVSESTPLAAGASGGAPSTAAIAGAVATASAAGNRQSLSHAAATASNLLSSVADTEAVPTDVAARPGIVLQGLTKVFPGVDQEAPRTAVDNLSLSIYEGQVTCLLGHNGSGKSTTINVLTGLMPATSGDATIYGLSVANDMPSIRGMMGVCPQHDVLFDQLTVKEHLELFGAIKGLTGETLQQRVTTMIADVGLQEKANAEAATLSGGQKRRLSVAIAMVGNPRVLWLDEPTSGLDPAARRLIWGMIQKYRAGRVIVLTTHYMDEADVLGDRIALLARGRLRVAGSPLFMKNRFGLGYRLTATIAQAAGHPTGDTPAALLAHVRRTVPSATLVSTIASQVAVAPETARLVANTSATAVAGATAGGGAPAATTTTAVTASEVSLMLPHDAVALFPALFDGLDALIPGHPSAAALDAAAAGGAPGDSPFRVLGYSMSMTSLEEVFMRLAVAVEEEEAAEKAHTTATGSTGTYNGAGADAPADTDAAHVTVGAPESTTTSTTSTTAPPFGKTWWLDARRRGSAFMNAIPDARLTSDAGRAASQREFDVNIAQMLPRAAKLYQRHSWAFMWRQITVMLWRRSRQLRRDRVSIWLQCVTPVIFVCVGAVFRLLRTVDSSASAVEAPMTTAGFAGALPASGPAAFGLPSVAFVGANTTWMGDLLTNVTRQWYVGSGSLYAPAPFPYSQPSSDAAIDVALNNGTFAAAALELQSFGAPANRNFNLLVAYNYTLANVLPTVLNLWNSALLAAATNTSTTNTHTISAAFDPLPSLSQSNLPALGAFLSSALQGFYTALGYAVIPAVQASMVVQERESRSKQMQIILGATPFAYWFSTWLWDTIQYLLPWIGGSIILLATTASSLNNAGQYVAIILLVLLYGVSVPGMTYTLSFLFSKHQDAQLWIRLSYTFATVLLFFSTFILDLPTLQQTNPSLATGSSAITYVGMVFPPFALAKGISDVIIKGGCNPLVLALSGVCDQPSAFAWGTGGSKMLYMALSVPIWFAVLLFIENRAIPGKAPSSAAAGGSDRAALLPQDGSQPAAAAGQLDGVQEDDDVRAEKARVDALASAGSEAASSLVLRHLRKVFPARSGGRSAPSKVAVADLSLQIQENEVCGVLGPNGAGKTTTLSMSVAELAPTSGEIDVFGVPISTARRAAMDVLGYCPQFDALFDLLTGEETLTFFAAINGVAPEHIPALVNAALAALSIERYRNTLVRAYSGGNKRRLSLCVAYVSAPRAVWLDEVSTGVDPHARKQIFNVVHAGRTGRATCMTTHVMEEAEGLCTRLGIMVDGRFACLGSPQHLKAKYGRGYALEVRLTERSYASPGERFNAEQQRRGTLFATLSAVTAGLRLVEDNSGHLRFEAAQVYLAGIFRALAAAREGLGIDDYSVSQTSLETVFLKFARQQEEVDERHRAAEAAHAAAGGGGYCGGWSR